MRILLIHRYFWPDTPPYAAMLRSIGKKLSDQGHEVTVLSSQPSYKIGVALQRQPAIEKVDGMVVHRLSLFRENGRHVIFRLMNMVYFPLRIIVFNLLKGKFDIVMASTAPPVVVGLAAAVGAKATGADFFYHCMDIHPEIGRISGEFSHPLVFNILRMLDDISCRIAKRVIVLSEDMRKSLLERPGYGQDNIQIINNFSMPGHDDFVTVDPKLLKSPGTFRVIFAGNIGRFQGLETFIDAMQQLAHRPGIEMVFVGEGSALNHLRERAGDAENIKFLPHQPVIIARKMIADADLGIVCLTREIYRYAYPSKTMTYLEEGCPLLVSAERESELVRFVESSNVGKWAQPGDPQSIADVVESIYLDSRHHEQMKKAAKQVSKEMFSEDSVMEKWNLLVKSADRKTNV